MTSDFNPDCMHITHVQHCFACQAQRPVARAVCFQKFSLEHCPRHCAVMGCYTDVFFFFVFFSPAEVQEMCVVN